MDFDYLCREVALRRVPKWIGAERFNIDALFVHFADAIALHLIKRFARSQILRFFAHHNERFGYGAMRVRVDGLYPAAIHYDLAAVAARVRRSARDIVCAATG